MITPETMPIELWILGAAWVFLLGACLGSFLNVCIYRIPLDQSVVSPPSHCFSCGAGVKWYDNIPILSALLLGARCRNCGAMYSPRYMFVEAFTGLLFVMVYLCWGTEPRPFNLSGFTEPKLLAVYGLVIFGLLLATFVDFDHKIIPDRVSIGGTIAGLVISPLVPALHAQETWLEALKSSGFGALVGFGTLLAIGMFGSWIFKKDAMGFGDVKLMAAVGAFLGWKAALFTIMASSFIGAFVGLGLIFGGKSRLQSQIPYGPYLAAAAVMWMFWHGFWHELWFRYILHMHGV